jgi:hypothetical protein
MATADALIEHPRALIARYKKPRNVMASSRPSAVVIATTAFDILRR